MANFQFGVLGSLEVLVNGSSVSVSAGKQRVVLVSLLVAGNRIVSVERLVELVWDDAPPASARNALQTYVMRLRRLLGGSRDGPLFTGPAGYGIEVAADALDLDRFTDLVRRGRTALSGGDVVGGVELLRQGLGLWRGEPLSDVPSQTLRRQVVPGLMEQWLGAVESRLEADLALGRHVEVLPELRELTARHPLRERLWAQQMRALYQSGRQAEALECYRTVSELLVEELGLDPGQELRELHQQVLTADPALTSPAAVRSVSIGASQERMRRLPAEITSFVGREVELAAGHQALQTERLVTLTGVGGVGKTRLAMRLAAQIEPEYADGVCLVDLAALTDPQQLGRTVAEAAGIYDQSMRPAAHVLADHLRDKRFLLMLDNCEHLVAAAAELVAELLPAIPGLRVLATSRQALGLVGEHLLTIPPLPVPSPQEATTDGGAALARNDAVRLLADRAARSSNIDVLNADPHTVVKLCQRLEGIPLATELAAIRLASLSIHEILDRLDDKFKLLSGTGAHITPAYHQTLQAVIDWSHDLCTEPEQRLWARLSVFAGEFDLEAAEAVCTGDGISREDVIDLIAALVRKSILSAHNHHTTTRYRLLETIRQYGQQRLSDHHEDLPVRRRHRDHYQQLAEHAAQGWCGPREVWWMDRLHQELPNLRAALEFCVTEPGEAEPGLDIAHNLTRARCWWFSGTLSEGRHWIQRILALHTGPPDRAQTTALAQAAWIALCQGDPTPATTLLDDAKTTAAQLGITDSLPTLQFVEGVHAFFTESDPAALPLLAQAKEGFKRLDQTGDHHMAALLWAAASALLADTNDAEAATSEFLTLTETQGTSLGYGFALWNRGLAELRHGQPRQAAELFRDALHKHETNDHWGSNWAAETLAWATAALGDHHHAATLLGTAHRMRQLTGHSITGIRPLNAHHEQTQQHLKQALGTHAYNTAHQQGATARTYHDAVSQALNHK